MKILVTGAGGFIGSHLLEELTRHDHEVRGMDLRPRPPFVPASVRWFRGDVTRMDAAREAVRGCDAVCHLAARVGDWGPPASYYTANVGGTRIMLEAAQREGARRFVLVSSLAVHHYRGHRAANEYAPRDGHITPYCHSKIHAEDTVRKAAMHLEWTIVRPGVFPFGPRDRTAFLPVARALRAGRMGLVNGGRARITTAYVANLVSGLRLALEHRAAAGEIFVMGDEPAITWRELLERFSMALGCASPRFSVPLAAAYPVAWTCEAAWRRLRRTQPPPLTRYRVLLAGRDCQFHSEHARCLLGYRPQVDLDAAIERTAAWARDELEA